MASIVMLHHACGCTSAWFRSDKATDEIERDRIEAAKRMPCYKHISALEPTIIPLERPWRVL